MTISLRRIHRRTSYMARLARAEWITPGGDQPRLCRCRDLHFGLPPLVADQTLQERRPQPWLLRPWFSDKPTPPTPIRCSCMPGNSMTSPITSVVDIVNASPIQQVFTIHGAVSTTNWSGAQSGSTGQRTKPHISTKHNLTTLI